LYAYLCLWDLAAADFVKASVLLHEPTGRHGWFRDAVLRLCTGDEAGYRKSCARMAEVLGGEQDKEGGYFVATTCLHVQKPVLALARLVQLAARAAADSKQP
jgi:hypothetical protein